MNNSQNSSELTPNFLTVTPDTFVTEAIALMSQHRSSCVMVVADEIPESPLVGLFTERDVVRLITSGIRYNSLSVASVMSRKLITIAETAAQDIFAAISKLREHRIRHLPVVGNNGNPIGLITPKSIREKIKPLDLLRHKKVSEVMKYKVIYAAQTAPIMEIAQMMNFHRVSCVVIVENTEMLLPVGIVTERDLVQFSNLGLDLDSTRAQSVMSAPLFPIKPEDSMWDANQIMEKYRVRRLVVSNKWDQLEGIITQTAILEAINPIEIWQTAQTLEEVVNAKTLEIEQLDLEFKCEINRRQQAELALQDSLNWLQAIADTSPHIIYVYDLTQQRCVYCSDRVGAIIGWTAAEIHQMASNVLPELLHPQDLAKLLEHFAKFDTLKNREAIAIQYRMHHKNGEWLCLRDRQTVVARDFEGKPRQILGSLSEIVPDILKD